MVVFVGVFYFYTRRHSVLKLWCNNSDFVQAVQAGHLDILNGRTESVSLNKMRLSALYFQVAVTRPLLCPSPKYLSAAHFAGLLSLLKWFLFSRKKKTLGITLSQSQLLDLTYQLCTLFFLNLTTDLVYPMSFQHDIGCTDDQLSNSSKIESINYQ